MPTFLTCSYRTMNCSNVLSNTSNNDFDIHKTCILQLRSVLSQVKSIASSSGNRTRDGRVRSQHFVHWTIAAYDFTCRNSSFISNVYNGLFHSRGDVLLPWQMEESIYLRFNLRQRFNLKGHLQPTVTQPIFFLTEFCLENFFLTVFREKKYFFQTVNCKKCFSKLFFYFSISFCIFWGKIASLRPAIFRGTPRNFVVISII